MIPECHSELFQCRDIQSYFIMYRDKPQLRGKWINGFGQEYSSRLMETECLCHRLNSLCPDMTAERNGIIRRLLGSIGDRFTIHSPFRCDFGCNISIGDDFVSNYNLTILDEEKVSIGTNVFIGPNTSIFTIDHAMLPCQRNRGIMRGRPVSIGDNVWIGGDVTILPGVTIGDGAVIGAGSVVTHDIPPMTTAYGNPCRPVRKIDDGDHVAEATEQNGMETVKISSD